MQAIWRGSRPVTVLAEDRGTATVQQEIDLELVDVNGDAEAAGAVVRNRTEAYRGADAFLICVSAKDEASLGAVNGWKAEFELQRVGPRDDIPIFVVLTQYVEAEDAANPVPVSAVRETMRANRINHSLIKTDAHAQDDVGGVERAFMYIIMKAYNFKYLEEQQTGVTVKPDGN